MVLNLRAGRQEHQAPFLPFVGDVEAEDTGVEVAHLREIADVQSHMSQGTDLRHNAPLSGDTLWAALPESPFKHLSRALSQLRPTVIPSPSGEGLVRKAFLGKALLWAGL